MKLLIAIALVALSTTMACADCLADLNSIMDAISHAGPYHVSMTSQAAGKMSSIEADVILPASEHLKTDQMEIIILPQGAWIKRGGKWQSAPGSMGANMLSAMTGTFKDTRSNVVCGDSEIFDGQSLPIYKYDSSGETLGIKTVSHVALYKGANGLPAGMIIDGTAMGVHSITTQHIKYDPSITIEPPK